MATQLTNYQCPACTGPLHFDGASGKLVCDFCGSSYDTAEIETLYAEKEAAAETAAQNKQAPPPDSVWSENEAAGLRSYSCPSCGAALTSLMRPLTRCSNWPRNWVPATRDVMSSR